MPALVAAHALTVEVDGFGHRPEHCRVVGQARYALHDLGVITVGFHAVFQNRGAGRLLAEFLQLAGDHQRRFHREKLLHLVQAGHGLLGQLGGSFGVAGLLQAGGLHQSRPNLQPLVFDVFLGNLTEHGVDLDPSARIQTIAGVLAHQCLDQTEVALRVLVTRTLPLVDRMPIGLGRGVVVIVVQRQLTQHHLPTHRQR
ncbi:hypothetical protein D3C81_388730 [compost metagenome]